MVTLFLTARTHYIINYKYIYYYYYVIGEGAKYIEINEIIEMTLSFPKISRQIFD